MIKWEYAVKRCSNIALQEVLDEYGKWGWELVQVLEKYSELAVIFKRPEKRDYNDALLVADPPPWLSVNAAKAQLGLDDLASVEDQEGTGPDSAARSRHPSASFDGVPPAPRVC